MTFALADYLQSLEMDPSNFVIHERISEIHAYRASILFEKKRYKVKMFYAFRCNVLPSYADTMHLQCALFVFGFGNLCI